MKRINRTVLEMISGILFIGIVCQIVGVFVVTRQGFYAAGLWTGILLACLSTVHMYRCLDRALDFAEGDASKIITGGYLIRYVVLAVILGVIMMTEVMNPLVVFMGYMSLKVTAFIQPFTHKICNKIFHETDPVPMALPEAVSGEK